MMQIAILEANHTQADLICQLLSNTYACRQFHSDKALFDYLRDDHCDLLVMDWQVADMVSAEVLNTARGTLPPAVPILFLANRSDEDTIIAALEAGANDYILKPIRRNELLTRVRVLLKRAYPEQATVEHIQFGPYLFEAHAGRLTIAGAPIDVTQKEFELALLFFRNLGRPLSRAYILETIWSRDADLPSRTMDTHVSRIRNKLGLRPENGFRLAPVYSYGYRLEQLPG